MSRLEISSAESLSSATPVGLSVGARAEEHPELSAVQSTRGASARTNQHPAVSIAEAIAAYAPAYGLTASATAEAQDQVRAGYARRELPRRHRVVAAAARAGVTTTVDATSRSLAAALRRDLDRRVQAALRRACGGDVR